MPIFWRSNRSPLFRQRVGAKREERPKFWYGLVSWATIQTVAYNAGQRQSFGVAAAGHNPNSPLESEEVFSLHLFINIMFIVAKMRSTAYKMQCDPC
jgi:hypothetical protein